MPYKYQNHRLTAELTGIKNENSEERAKKWNDDVWGYHIGVRGHWPWLSSKFNCVLCFVFPLFIHFHSITDTNCIIDRFHILNDITAWVLSNTHYPAQARTCLMQLNLQQMNEYELNTIVQ